MLNNAAGFSSTEHTSGTMDTRPGQLFENCPTCERETAHSVSIELRQERIVGGRTKYAKEPYRVSVCDSCGETEHLRMNDR